MAVDFFLHFDAGAKIEGETKDSKLKDKKAIELLSWSFGETNSGSMASNTGGGAGKVSMQDFHFTMRTNQASPALFLACASGQHIKDATLTCRKAGKTDEQITYMTVKFSDLLVSSYQTGGSDGATSELPVDQISLNFAKIELDYFSQDATTGKATDKKTAGWDLKANKKV